VENVVRALKKYWPENPLVRTRRGLNREGSLPDQRLEKMKEYADELGGDPKNLDVSPKEIFEALQDRHPVLFAIEYSSFQRHVWADSRRSKIIDTPYAAKIRKAIPRRCR